MRPCGVAVSRLTRRELLNAAWALGAAAVARPLVGGGMPMARVEVGWEIARDRRFTDVVQKGTAVARAELSFAVCGCNHYEAGYFTAFRRSAGEAFDFVFHTGDYIYFTIPDVPTPPPTAALRFR